MSRYKKISIPVCLWAFPPFAGLIGVLWLQACGSTANHTKNDTSTRSEPSLPVVIDLLKLEKEKFFQRGQTVEVKYDAVYHQPKRYRGMPLREVLSQKVRLNQLDTSRVTLLFECRDRYVVSMPLGQALSRPAFIVDQDLDAPPGKQWVPISKGDETKDPAPFYMVWKDAPSNDFSFVWPYQLTAIKLTKSPE